MKLLGLEISKKVLIGIIASIVVVGGGVTVGIIVMSNDHDNQKQEEKQKETILLKEDLKFEINSEVKLSSLVSEDNKVKIVSEDEIIDTSTLGEKEVTIKYEIEEQEEEKSFKIIIIDTQAPVIEYPKELTTTAGTKIDLLKDVKVSDNSKEEIEVNIEGEYNFDNEGTYNLKYVAVDSSNNKKEEEFTLKVNKKATTSSVSKPTGASDKTQSIVDDEPAACPAQKGKITYSPVFTDRNKALAWNVGYDCEKMRLMEFILAYDPNIKQMRTLEWVYPSMYDNWDPNFQKDAYERQQMDKWLKTYHPELLQKTYTDEEVEAKLRQQGMINDNTISISGDYWSQMKLGSETHYYFWSVQG